MPVLRRARGALLRLVRRRPMTLIVGLCLALPAAWLELAGSARGLDAWWVDGVALIAGATGAALIWTALTGRRADWTE